MGARDGARRNLVLVEASSASFTDLLSAVNFAVAEWRGCRVDELGNV